LAESREKLISKAKKLQAQKANKELMNSLPHKFKIKPYQWQLDYWASTNRMKFVCSGNQVGKSSAQIIHAIDLATDETKWKKFFPKRPPQVFWYIYPSKGKVQEEFQEKWIKEFLPKGSMTTHQVYGWKEFKVDNEFAGIRFNNGISIYFKSWGQDLQAGTVDAVFADEELPVKIFPELQMRLTATFGIFSMVFTATLNQKLWFDVIEKVGKRGEKFPEAFKKQVSMEFDCRFFADGSPSHFTEEVVNKKKNSMPNQAEIDRRIHGRFVASEGRKFKSFNKIVNVKPRTQTPSNWEFYGGVDVGTGGDGHPPAISIVAIKPDMKYGKLIKFWKGNDGSNYNSSQVLNRYIEMTAELVMTNNYYDWHSKEFKLRADEAGIPFNKAEKGHDFGDDLLNTLFKNRMLDLEECEQVEDLIQEFETLKHETPKTIAEDDGIDSLRYAVSKIPWDFVDITTAFIELVEKEKEEVLDERQKNAVEFAKKLQREEFNEKEWDYETEIDEYNDILNITGDYYDDY
jgi:phage terminase large subunit-like protein